jgi:hypothetical protein
VGEHFERFAPEHDRGNAAPAMRRHHDQIARLVIGDVDNRFVRMLVLDGGKSHLMRIAAIAWCHSIPGLQVYLFRRIFDDLIKNHMEGRRGFRALLAPWVAAGMCTIVESEIRFFNGSKIYLCHCEHEKHIYKYQGSEMDVLLIEMLGLRRAHIRGPLWLQRARWTIGWVRLRRFGRRAKFRRSQLRNATTIAKSR